MTALTTFATPEPEQPPVPADATPVVTMTSAGRYVVSYPRGPATFTIATDLFESMVRDINQGRHVVDVLKGVADALQRVVPSSAETQSGTP